MCSAALMPAHLTCNHAVNPLGIDTPQPSLSWELQGPGRQRRQTAYRLLVASSLPLLEQDQGDLWDSGRVAAAQSIQVPYAGGKLRSRQRCWWKVCVWDEQQQAGAFSAPAWWEMGLLSAKDWRAQWIAAPRKLEPSAPHLTASPAPYFRKPFRLTRPVVAARAYISGLGYYELHLNGRKVGDHVLDPLVTKYDRRVLYVTHDITDFLREGANMAGVVLGTGWYDCHTPEVWDFTTAPWRHMPKLIAQFHFQHADGTETRLVTDGSWQMSAGPIVFDGLRNGEYYDARREQPDWCLPGGANQGWEPALIIQPPGGDLTAQTLPIKVMQTLDAVALTEPKPGVFVFDLGQNLAGWAQLRVRGAAGTEVTLRYAERLAESGEVDQDHIKVFLRSGGECQTDKYILKGSAEDEVWEPRFTYHGFRWVQVTGFPGRPTLQSLRARVVHSAFAEAGNFECANEQINRIQHCTRWAYISNFVGIPTDCPHREKNGWMGDAQLATEAGLFNYQAAPAYLKWLNDMADEQRRSGQLPGIVPTGGWGYNWGSGPAWDSAYTHIPWYLYLYCGDASALRQHYAGMKRYVDFMAQMATDHILEFGLGDWCPPGGGASDHKTPTAMTSTGYYYANCMILARTAALLGKKSEQRRYLQLASRIQKAFLKRFVDPVSGACAGDGQTSMACALFHELVSGPLRVKVEQQLLDAIAQNKGLLDYGILGSKYVPNALTAAGRTDVAWSMALQTAFPSYGHCLAQGATTLWESWPGDTSRNHVMFGEISAWLFKALAGINPHPEQPGFKRIIMHPHPVPGLDWVRAEHRSPYGWIRSAWEQSAAGFTLRLTIPVNTSAEVYLPAADPAQVRLDGQSAAQSGARLLRVAEGCAVFEIGSGDYQFEVRPSDAV